MTSYKFLKRKTFEKLENFEARLNEEAGRGWKAVSFVQVETGQIVLLERAK